MSEKSKRYLRIKGGEEKRAKAKEEKAQFVMSRGITGLVNTLRRRIKYFDLESAQNKLTFAEFRKRFNEFFNFLEEWQSFNPDIRTFEPTLNMLTMYIGFPDWDLMKQYLNKTPYPDRMNKPISEGEIRTVLAIFHEVNAAGPAASATWLRRHFPHEWSTKPDLTKGATGVNVGMESDGSITLKVVRDYRAPEGFEAFDGEKDE